MNGLHLRDSYYGCEVRPALLVEWVEPNLDCSGCLAIQSLRGGACGGGTRLKVYAGAQQAREDAIALAKTMELKFLVARFGIGGAKSVIRCKPEFVDATGAARRAELLTRWFHAILPFIRERYGTGPDENTVDSELQIALAKHGVIDPRLGVAAGHFGDYITERLRSVQLGMSEVVEEFAVGENHWLSGELITAYGLLAAINAVCLSADETLVGKRVLLEGFGTVGAAAATLLHHAGAVVVGISTLSRTDSSTRNSVCVAERGVIDVGLAVRERSGTCVSGVDVEMNDPRFWSTPADIFIAAATSGTLTVERLELLRGSGVHLIVCGANNPFADSPSELYADQNFCVLPDFVTNCGTARAFAYLLANFDASGPRWNELAIDVSDVICSGLRKGAVDGEFTTGMLDRSYSYWIAEATKHCERP